MKTLRHAFALFALATVISGSPASAAAALRSNTDESKVGSLPLPDPLRAEDGTAIGDVAAWRARRRPELLRLFATEVYGRTPDAPRSGLRWETTSVDRTALRGKATRKEVTIHFTAQSDGPKLHLLIYQPNTGPGPFPAFLGLNYFGNQCVNADPGIALSTAWMRTSAEFGIVNNRATEKTRGVHAHRWDVETVVARGYASVTAYYGDLCPDHVNGLGESVGALLKSGTTEQRPADGWGAIGVWAWGLSRALDYLQSDREIDARRVAVHGHSRLGKAALWAGVQDERFALVISNDSGCGGAALSKRDFGETVAMINKNFPFWFALNFRKYNDREAALPVDQHELLALVAPRPLYVASASEDLHADPKGEFLAAKFAEPVYALYGKKGLGVAAQPPVDHPVGETIGYHLRTGKHDITPYDWAQYLDFADRHLKPQP
ncbi:MAG: acetylxylan esterase [Verrucomicrobia bacterium]|nr:acetylxylan esterase [Verrucomicrobiota bacterium]